MWTGKETYIWELWTIRYVEPKEEGAEKTNAPSFIFAVRTDKNGHRKH